jgi:hypothetical protein
VILSPVIVFRFVLIFVSIIQVRYINLTTKKIGTLYETSSPVLSLVASLNEKAIISGHVDGKVYYYSFEESTDPVCRCRFLLII